MKTLKASVEGDWETLYIHTLPKRAQYKQTKGSLKKTLEYFRVRQNTDKLWWCLVSKIAVNLFQLVMLIIIIRK